MTEDEKKRIHAEYMRDYRQKHPEKVQAAIRRAKQRLAEQKAADPGFKQKQYYDKAKRKVRYQRDSAHPDYKPYQAAAVRASYAKLRKKILEGYGGRCMCCGESEPTFLEIDHVHGGGSEHYRHENAGTSYRRIIKEGFPDRFQLLCCNCNRGRARHGGICPHKSKSV